MPVFYYPGVSGSYVTGNGTVSTSSFADSGESSLVINNPNGNFQSVNAFLVKRTRVTGSLAFGTHRYGSSKPSYRVYTAYPVGYSRRRWTTTMSIPGGLDNQLFAATNPSRPDIHMPAIIAELRDLPDMIREVGRWLFNPKRITSNPHRELGQMWVSGNFGWLPLLADLCTMVRTPNAFAQREKEFDRLYSGSGLKRRVGLWSGQGASETISFVLDQCSVSFTGRPTAQVWGTVRYKPIPSSKNAPTRRKTPDDIARRMLGLNARNLTASVWEALPWSWFIDYFYDVSGFLAAHGMEADVTAEGACIMTHIVANLASPGDSQLDSYNERLTITPGNIVYEEKHRSIATPSVLPQLRMPRLSGRQLSILGAITVLRVKPRHGG